MKTKVSEEFLAEVERYRLKFCCEDCAYYCSTEESCSEGYPNQMHRLSSLKKEKLIFCKLFELGG